MDRVASKCAKYLTSANDTAVASVCINSIWAAKLPVIAHPIMLILEGMEGKNMEELVLVSRRGSLIHIELNRPRSLNSLTLPMVRTMANTLDEYVEDPSVAAFALTGAGERAFCSGGDIKSLSIVGSQKPEVAAQFWREEYQLICRIAELEKPWIAIMDGITMGGGVGLAVHSRYRVATERTVWAMPECQIGLFPDVGTTKVLGQMRDGFGRFLGLTGQRLGGSDLMISGLADYHVPSHFIASLLEGLADGEEPRALLRKLATDPGPPHISLHRNSLSGAFAGNDLAKALERFSGLEDSALAEARSGLAKASPSSLRITWELMEYARNDRQLADTVARELTAAMAALAGHDFHEGVRAKLIDKDNRPQWSDV